MKSCLAAHRDGLVKGLAHITGGGLTENVPRILPDGIAAILDPATWNRPAIFDWLATEGGVAPEEMIRTFNCGIGMVAVVAAGDADAAERLFAGQGETVYRIGEIAARGDGPAVVLPGLDAVWRG